GLLLNLVDEVAGAGPVEPDRRGPDPDVKRAEQCRERGRNAAEQRPRCRTRAAGRRVLALLSLDLLPPGPHLSRGIERPFPGLAREAVRMAANQLVGDA